LAKAAKSGTGRGAHLRSDAIAGSLDSIRAKGGFAAAVSA